MQEKIPDDVTSTLSDFLSYLAKNGVVDPHIECHNVSTQFTKNEQDAMTRCSVTISSAEPCAFKVMKRAANVAPECDNLGSALVLGSDSKSWDISTCKHSMGYVAIKGRTTYDGHPNVGGLAPLKFGVCLEKTIRIKKDTLRQLA